MKPLRICLAVSELTPFAKTGGLADVVAGLARWLGAQGHDVRVFTPLYERVARRQRDLRPVDEIGRVRVPFDVQGQEFTVSVGTLPESAVPIYFVDAPALYRREPLYSDDYQDEALRFALLSRAVLESCQRLDWVPDVFHCNDWHTALLPLYKRTLYDWDRKLWPARTLLSIHNIGFQGRFGRDRAAQLGLRGQERLLHQGDLARGEINCMRSGLLYADWISTVSETYAREIRTPAGGMGLENDLQARRQVLTGIVNGCDYGTWDPRSDPFIPAPFDRADLAGKQVCKRRLLERMAVPYADGCVVFGLVSRLTAQKGLDLLPDVLPVFLRQNPQVRFVALGAGEPRYEEFLQELRDAHPGQVGIYRGYDEELAHWIEAGADLFVMPSRFEPCGLNQMYSMRYGTVPIVRYTGGLADTVRAWNPLDETGTGYVFGPFEPFALLRELRNALGCYAHPPAWRRLQQNAMAEDWSWERQGPEYVALYRRVAAV